MHMDNTLWFAAGLFVGGWGLYIFLEFRGRIQERKRKATEFTPRAVPLRKPPVFRDNSQSRARQSKAHIIGPR